MKKEIKKFTVPNSFNADKSHFYATNNMLQFPYGGNMYPGGGQLGSGMLAQEIRQSKNAPKKPVQLDNPRLGPSKQNNQGNTATIIPNSKLPKTLNPVRNPVAEKKALERQTRELVQSGAASRSLQTLGDSNASVYQQTQDALINDPNFLNTVAKNELNYAKKLEQKHYDDASYLEKGVNFGTAFLANPITTGANLLEGYRPFMQQAEILRNPQHPLYNTVRNTGGIAEFTNAFNPGNFVANYADNSKKGKYLDAAVNAGEILLAPTAVGALGDIKDVGKAVQKTGKYLTTKTPLKNAYKINPWAFKPNPEMGYRMLGKEGFEDAIQTGSLRAKPIPNKPTEGISLARNTNRNPNTGKMQPALDRPYFADGVIDERYAADYMAEVNKTKNNLIPIPTHKGIAPSEARSIPLKNANLYKKDWLKGYKQIEVPKSNFQSEIDWGKWNKEIPENKALMQEYNTIEQQAKANGSWMKNPDGSTFKGSPEQFVQQNSENFKKAFGNSKLINPDGSPTIQYHGSAKKFDTFDESKFQLGDSGYSGRGIYTTPDKGKASSYSLSSKSIHKDGNYEPNVYELYGQGNNPISAEDLIKQKKEYDLFNFHRAKDWQGDVPLERQMLDYDVAIRNQTRGVERISPWHQADELVFPSNKQLKSAIGNNGMFDMTNPNIYKSVLPIGLGVGATAYGLSDKQKQNVNYNSYAYGGSLEGGRKTSFPEDNFMKGGKNIYDSVYASSLGNYYPGGGQINNQSSINDTKSCPEGYILYNGQCVKWEEPKYANDANKTGYDEVTGTIITDPNNPYHQTASWLEHEKFHHLQNLAGSLSNSGAVGLKPNPFTASDQSIENYYNRRASELNDETNQMVFENPDLQFIPKEKLYETVFPSGQDGEEPSFVGSDNRMYNNPTTVEGEARTYENATQYGMPTVFPGLKNNSFGVEKNVTPNYLNTSGPINNLENTPILTDSEMKARIATASALGNPSAQRMTAIYPKDYTFTGNETDSFGPLNVPAGEKGTHFMMSMGNYAVPVLQENSGQLGVNPNANITDKEALKFNSPEEANYFSENYKNVAPMMWQWNSNFKNGGYLHNSSINSNLDKLFHGHE